MTNNNLLTCRFCKHPLTHTFVDLGMSPIANDLVSVLGHETRRETFYPLKVYICEKCLLVQLPNHRREEEIFTDNYTYFSSYSTSWLSHAKNYTEMITRRLGLTSKSLVVELASNDGYLLQYFKEKEIPVLGVEPTGNVARAAVSKGIDTVVKFFGVDTASELVKSGKKADLLIGNNVLAHVPDLNDFVGGMKIMLSENGVITMEFPHLMKLMEFKQFDTIYHEHYSYYSFTTVEKIFRHHGLTLFNVEELSTHGGSLRIYGKHSENDSIAVEKSISKLKEKERVYGLTSITGYMNFGKSVAKVKRDFLAHLIQLKEEGKQIIGYGAAAKGVTFLNYCGVGVEFIDYVVDKSPHKQNHFLPGVRIPIYSPAKIKETKPDYVVILPWNLREEIMGELSYVREWKGKFITAIPQFNIE